MTDPTKQWRIDNAPYLVGARLRRQRWTEWSEEWDHDHCACCWAKFATFDGPDIQHEGYATTSEHVDGADYHWVCVRCFEELKDDMGWRL